MIIDGATAITGSFDFTRVAEAKNAENVFIVHDPARVARYAENWRAHAEHSEAYTPKQVGARPMAPSGLKWAGR